MDAVSKDRLRCILHYLIYLERDAWLVGGAKIPELERQMLLQRVLGDIAYVEKEEFNIRRQEGDNLYIDLDTASMERLRRLCDRVREMWKRWHTAESESDLGDLPKPQKRRRVQRSPGNHSNEMIPISKLYPLEKWLSYVLRYTAANVAESRVSQIIHEHFPRQWIRALESAGIDGALVLEKFFDPC